LAAFLTGLRAWKLCRLQLVISDHLLGTQRGDRRRLYRLVVVAPRVLFLRNVVAPVPKAPVVASMSAMRPMTCSPSVPSPRPLAQGLVDKPARAPDGEINRRTNVVGIAQ
jgi:hypothetical protein